ncbi:MAG TPA: hypothetical protein VH681_01705 [Nitrospiraceae bacterium]
MSVWKFRPIVFGTTTFLAILIGCQDDPLSPIWDHPLVEGDIIDLGTDVGRHEELAMLVEGEQRVIFSLNDDTEVYGTDSARISVEDLVIGARVRVWPRGVVLTSDPLRGDAGRVEVLPTK